MKRHHKKRARRFQGYEPPRDVVRLKRARFVAAVPRISAAWMRSVSAITQNYL